MIVTIGRRELLVALGGAAVAWPLAARAEQPAMPLVAYLSVGVPPAHLLAVFKQGLAEAGFVEGRNVAIETQPMATTIACRRWLPTWCVAKWP